jgi:hypothetical protein
MSNSWIDGPLVSSYARNEVIVGQCVQQGAFKFQPRTFSNFDLTALNDDDTGPKLIASGYRSMEEARTAMEQYWTAKEHA